jgi:hypothetical protein
MLANQFEDPSHRIEHVYEEFIRYRVGKAPALSLLLREGAARSRVVIVPFQMFAFC